LVGLTGTWEAFEARRCGRAGRQVEQDLLDDGTTHDAAGIQVLSAAEVAPRGYYRLSVVKCTPPVYRTPFARGGSMYPLEVYPPLGGLVVPLA